MPTTPQMSLVLPTVGSDSGTWATKVNAALTLVDSHDHSTGKGVQVPTAGININADLTFSGLYAPTHVHRISFDGAAIGSNNKSIFVSDGSGGLVANELYWRTNGGTNVRLTNGTALNVAAFTGGIGGDYSTIGALVDYDDATDTYRMRQETASAVRQYAKVACADLKLTEYKASGATPVPSNSVTLKSPAALAASYSVTWPGAVPAATELVSMTSSGVLAADGAHGDRVLMISPFSGTTTTDSNWIPGVAPSRQTSAAFSALFMPIGLRVGDRIKSVSYLLMGDGAADVTVDVSKTDSTMTDTSIGSLTTNNQPASWSIITINVTDTVVASNMALSMTFSASAAGIQVGNIAVTYDRPP